MGRSFANSVARPDSGPLPASPVSVCYQLSLQDSFGQAVAVANVKTPTGTMRVSTPETSVVDLVRFSKSGDHLDNVATVISELAASLDAKELLKAVKLVGDIPNARRSVYILDQVRARKAAIPLREWIDLQSPSCIPLRTGRNGGTEDRRWHVLVDRPLEVEIDSTSQHYGVACYGAMG
jgi:hypothetical protein